LKPTGLVAIIPALILAACYGAPNLAIPQAAQFPSGGGPGQGIDMPTDASDALDALQASRVDFVARYYRDPDSGWPALSPSEARRLSALGLKIVAVYEWHSPDPSHFTYASGYSDAMSAYAQARAVGQPAGSAIYFAVDFKAQDDDLGSVADYFRGVNAGLAAAGGGIGAYAVGVYGSGVVCDAVKRAGLARYSWLSNSINWDGATDYQDWDIMQGAALPGLPFDNDSDQARNDYGGFEVTGNGIPPSFDIAGSVTPSAPSVAPSR
jgi:Rv2525c-like, glycoside hydrolase-like domain